MKPRTKKQAEVFRLSKIVLDINDRLKQWVFSECNDHIGIATKNHFWCIDCGEESPISLVQNNKAVCPMCSSNLSITTSRKRTFEQFYYVAAAEMLGDYQVVRLFEVKSYHKKGQDCQLLISENIQQFINYGTNDIVYKLWD